MENSFCRDRNKRCIGPPQFSCIHQHAVKTARCQDSPNHHHAPTTERQEVSPQRKAPRRVITSHSIQKCEPMYTLSGAMGGKALYNQSLTPQTPPTHPHSCYWKQTGWTSLKEDLIV